MSKLDTDTIARSNTLFTLAERFEIEATLWKDPNCQAQLQRSAHLLAEIARATVRGNTDEITGEAYIAAGTRIITEVEGARRFILGARDIPNVARRHVEP